MKTYYIYILASRSGVLYVGVTNDLVRRVWEHRNDLVPGFTKRYQTHQLVYFEETDDALAAISREKHIKKWLREWKVRLIESTNPGWRDLYEELVLDNRFPPARE